MSASEQPTFFSELYAMSVAVGPVGATISADPASGKMTVVVIPCPVDGKKDTTLCEPLCLTGTVQEFDAEFVGALMDYRPQVQSFSEQIALNHARVEQAGKAAVASATKPPAKPGQKPALPKPATPPALPAPASARPASPPAVNVPKSPAVDAGQGFLFDADEPETADQE